MLTKTMTYYMRNKIFLSILLLGFVLVACNQEPQVGRLGDPDERLNAVLKEYRDHLTSSTYGWKAFLYPGEGGGFNFYMQFSTEGRVTMLGDISEETATVPYESSFRVDAFQRPSLVFDTYNYLHYLSDPDPEVNGGILGIGYISDFEFSFESSQTDTVRLKGNQHQSELILVRASKKESEAYRSGKLNTVMKEVMDYQKNNAYLFLISDNNAKTGVFLNPSTRALTLIEDNGENDIEVTSSRFSFTTDGILLHDKLAFRDLEFTDIFLDAANDKMYLLTADDQRIDVKSLSSPVFPMHQLIGIDFITVTLKPDPVQSPGWSANFRSMWISIDDAFDACCELRLSDIQFIFNSKTRQMDINVYVRDTGSGYSYRLRYPYTYVKTWNGIFTFKPSVTESPNYNAQYFKPILSNFLSEFDEVKFQMDYLKTDTDYVGQLKSQDHPGFYLAGELR